MLHVIQLRYKNFFDLTKIVESKPLILFPMVVLAISEEHKMASDGQLLKRIEYKEKQALELMLISAKV